MALHRGIDGSEPLRGEPIGRVAGPQEHRPATGAWRLGTGTVSYTHLTLPTTPYV